MSRIHNVESLACAAAKLVGVREITNDASVVTKANETAKAVMDKIMDLLKEDSLESLFTSERHND